MTRFRAIALAIVLPAAVQAHEFWIDPHAFQVAPGESVLADLRVGQEFSGSLFSYVPANFRRFDTTLNGVTEPVPGRAGDRPALNLRPKGEGLLIVTHVTRDMTLTYSDLTKFEKFARHKDFLWALEEHARRGLPDTGFREQYSRHAKSLIAVGSGVGSDREMGLVTEIVALENPYTDDMSDGFTLKVLYDGAPRARAQVELFDKAPDGTVSIEMFRTDEDGVATVTVSPGHSYLADAVVLRPMTPETAGGPVWESLWASLTFAVPAD